MESEGREKQSHGAVFCSGSISCSVCLEIVADRGERSIAKLKCGHHFHLAEFDDSTDEPWPNSLGPATIVELQDMLNLSQTYMPASSCLSFTSTSAINRNKNVLPDDPIFEDSLSLQDLGLSDACLATLACEGNFSGMCDLPIQRSEESKYQDKELPLEQLHDPDVLLNSNCLAERQKHFRRGSKSNRSNYYW